MQLLNLDDPRDWPPALLCYLGKHYEILLKWETKTEPLVSGHVFDAVITELRTLLRGIPELVILGYHCTKLTDAEIEIIQTQGMHLPCEETLFERLDLLREQGLLSEAACEKLKRRNQAADINRKGMLCFFFYEPHVAGQSGIESFFTYWGGEALYNYNENELDTGPWLRDIGTPCIVKVYVPVAHLTIQRGLDTKIVQNYLMSRSQQTIELSEHEDRCIEPIHADYISRVIKYPEQDFLSLTQCNEWQPKVSFQKLSRAINSEKRAEETQ